MSMLNDPTIIPEGTPNPEFWYNTQLQQLYFASQNLHLTSTETGTIANDDKAGNISGVWVVFTSNASANTEDAVAHALGRVPLAIFAAIPDKAAAIYDSGTAWTDTTIYVKSSVASVAWNLLVF